MPVTAPGPDPCPSCRRRPLVVAASLVGLEAFVLAALGVLELANLRSIRLTMGLTTTAFFLVARPPGWRGARGRCGAYAAGRGARS